MGRIAGHFEWDDDELTPGRKREGGLHQNLFDHEGRLKGNARFVPHDDRAERLQITETVFVPIEERRRSREEEELQQAIAALVSALIDQAIARGKPLLERWWRENARPSLSAQRVQLAALRRRSRRQRKSVEGTATHESSALPPASEGSRLSMSSAEARARYLAALAARAYSDEQLRLISSADIVDTHDVAALERSLSALPPDQVGALLRTMVTNPSLLEDDALAALASVLGPAKALDS